MTILAELSESGTHIEIFSDWRFKELSESIPGATWDRKKEHWRVPISWSACLALRSTFLDQLEIGPRLAEWAQKERYNRIDPASELARAFDAEGDADLYPFQRAGVQFLASARQAILADDPGSGKTVQAIRTLMELTRRGEEVFPALVVCPSTMKRTWKREFDRWWPGLTVTVVSGSATQRRKQLDTPSHVYVMNWESLKGHSRLASYGSVALKRCRDCGGLDDRITEGRCEVHLRELNAMKFKAVIADEAHRMKEAKAAQTRALKAATGDADIRFALTGTPIANDVTDLWSILNWLCPEEWPGRTKWINRMVDVMLNAFGGMTVLGVKPNMDAEFQSALAPRMRRMTKEVVLPFLPPIVFERREIEMTAKQAKAYKQMQKDMLAEMDDGTLLTSSSPLTQTVRLLQLASSFGEVETIEVVDTVTGEVKYETKLHLTEPSCKLDAFMDDLPDFGKEQVAVMAVSRQLIDLLSARLTKKKIPHGLVTGAQSEWERNDAIERFQAGRDQFLLFTAAAGGVGVTLTAARYLVRLQRPWSSVDDIQALNRVHRIGSEIHDTIIVIDYQTAKTLESRVVEVLGQKHGSFQDIVRDRDLLRKALEESAKDEDDEKGSK